MRTNAILFHLLDEVPRNVLQWRQLWTEDNGYKSQFSALYTAVPSRM
jgi:hypothetical protein